MLAVIPHFSLTKINSRAYERKFGGIENEQPIKILVRIQTDTTDGNNTTRN